MNRILPTAALVAFLFVLGVSAMIWTLTVASVWPAPTYAAEMAAEVTAEAPWTGLSAIVMPYVMEIVASIIGLFLLIVTDRLRQWVGLKIDDEHRALLHSAAMTGIRAALEAGSKDPVGDAVDYVFSAGAPRAAKRLKASADDVREIAKSKMLIVK